MREGGASILGLLLVLAIALLVAWLLFTRYLGVASEGDEAPAGQALDSARQQRTLADMRAIARAGQLMRVATGSYPTDLRALQSGGYMQQVPATDAWGNPWRYTGGRDTYSLASLGADGREGPPPPSPWTGAPYEPDLVLTNGQLTQAPSGR